MLRWKLLGVDVVQDSCVLELHQSFGSDYRTLAACHLRLHDVLERSNGRLHGTVSLTGQWSSNELRECGCCRGLGTELILLSDVNPLMHQSC